MKRRLLILALLITSLLCYNEWAGGNSAFIFEMEAMLFAQAYADPASTLHVFSVLPVLGQLFLIVALFLKHTARVLIWLGMVFIGILVLLVGIGGVMQWNIRIISSVLPFFLTVFLTIRYLRGSAQKRDGNGVNQKNSN